MNLHMTNSKLRYSDSAYSITYASLIKIVYFLDKHQKFRDIQLV